MNLALAVLVWTASVCLVFITLAVVGYLGALGKRANAQAENERRLH